MNNTSRFNPKGLRCIGITNRKICRQALLHVARELLLGGVTAIMLREKDLSSKALYDIALPLKELCHKHDGLFLVNRSIEVALAVGADGVHLGGDALPLTLARGFMRDGMIIGVSAHGPGDIKAAYRDGADYVTVSPVFPPTSKESNLNPLGLRGLAELIETSPLPVIALGGITPEKAQACMQQGAAGVAAIGALFGSENPREAACGFRSEAATA